MTSYRKLQKSATGFTSSLTERLLFLESTVTHRIGDLRNPFWRPEWEVNHEAGVLAASNGHRCLRIYGGFGSRQRWRLRQCTGTGLCRASADILRKLLGPGLSGVPPPVVYQSPPLCMNSHPERMVGVDTGAAIGTIASGTTMVGTGAGNIIVKATITENWRSLAPVDFVSSDGGEHNFGRGVGHGGGTGHGGARGTAVRPRTILVDVLRIHQDKFNGRRSKQKWSVA